MPALEIRGLRFAYGRATVLDGIDLAVEPGEIVTVIGPNGAGKSTLLNVVSGALRPTGGTIAIGGRDTTRLRQADVVRHGCLLVPEGRQVFASMTVADNLLLGRYSRRRTSGAAPGVAADVTRVHELFPRLAERAGQLAGTLSGGEQQMLAIGRAMMGRPAVMLLDEPSLGLSPQLVARIMAALATLRADGLTIVLVEQNARAALALADRGHLLQAGRIVGSGSAAELAADPTVAQVYLGGTAAQTP